MQLQNCSCTGVSCTTATLLATLSYNSSAVIQGFLLTITFTRCLDQQHSSVIRIVRGASVLFSPSFTPAYQFSSIITAQTLLRDETYDLYVPHDWYISYLDVPITYSDCFSATAQQAFLLFRIQFGGVPASAVGGGRGVANLGLFFGPRTKSVFRFRLSLAALADGASTAWLLVCGLRNMGG